MQKIHTREQAGGITVTEACTEVSSIEPLLSFEALYPETIQIISSLNFVVSSAISFSNLDRFSRLRLIWDKFLLYADLTNSLKFNQEAF